LDRKKRDGRVKKMLNFVLSRIRLDRLNNGALRWLIKLSGIKLISAQYKYDHFLKQPVLNATLLLPGKGCTWAKTENGGCSMCGFKNALSSLGIKRVFTDREILRLFALGLAQIARKHPKILNIYNGGSFFSEDELSYAVQEEIIKKIRNNTDIETLFVESRPEFMMQERLAKLVSYLKPKTLKIGIGLEAVTDRIRNDYINKGISRDSYEKAVKIAKDSGARVLTYILIKPLFLSEKEAIGEAIETARYAFGAGSDEVSFESSCIQKGTKMEELYNQGRYRPPWLWSIIEVAKAAHTLGNIQLGSFWDFPLPLAKPHNCPKCSANVEELLNNYRVNHNLDVFNQTDCSCKEEWRKAIS
jgi:hypothetical protein